MHITILCMLSKWSDVDGTEFIFCLPSATTPHVEFRAMQTACFPSSSCFKHDKQLFKLLSRRRSKYKFLGACSTTTTTMGVNGIWKTILSTAEKRSLLQLATSEGFETNRRGRRMLVVGVDMSNWITRLQTGIYKRGRDPRLPSNPIITVIFKHLAKLLSYPIIVVCVFDGPGRPSTKRGKKVAQTPFSIVGRLQELITALGFYYIMAPAEAESQLAYLNRCGTIDAVITEDSDAWVFGAKHVLRKDPDSKELDKVIVYSYDRIRNSSTHPLTYAGILLITILVGGDYDKGLKHCGIVTALALASSPLATSLHHAVLHMSPTDLQQFLIIWRHELRQELAHNTHGYLCRAEPTTAGNVNESFPSVKVLRLYVHPTIVDIDPNMFIVRLPDFSRLVQFADKQFSWGEDRKLVAEFRQSVWPGYFMRQALLMSIDPKQTLTNYDPGWTIIRSSKKKDLTLRALSDGLQHQDGLSDSSLTFGIPTIVLETAFPVKVMCYFTAHKRTKQPMLEPLFPVLNRADTTSEPSRDQDSAPQARPPMDIVETSSESDTRLSMDRDNLEISSESDEEYIQARVTVLDDDVLEILSSDSSDVELQVVEAGSKVRERIYILSDDEDCDIVELESW